jgi:hypothetical protein
VAKDAPETARFLNRTFHPASVLEEIINTLKVLPQLSTGPSFFEVFNPLLVVVVDAVLRHGRGAVRKELRTSPPLASLRVAVPVAPRLRGQA